MSKTTNKFSPEVRERPVRLVSSGGRRRMRKIVRLMSIPGVGAISVTAVHAVCPSMTTFRSRRDFAAWAGLTPR